MLLCVKNKSNQIKYIVIILYTLILSFVVLLFAISYLFDINEFLIFGINNAVIKKLYSIIFNSELRSYQ
ncbi:MAG: hypothetical protein COB77_01130 [Gammaproteobacteria bacterium]|nr:MAG: hypothetical protein COB77_01130 [Gammaproteobacteria bacterium]